MIISNKAMMYRHLEAGRFGNRIQTWRSIQEIRDSGYSGLVSMRCLDVGNPTLKYHLSIDQIEAEIEELLPAQRRAGFVFSEAPPDHKRSVQGELIELDTPQLRYSYSPLPMRLAFAEQSLYATGGAARLILKTNLEDSDYLWLLQLLDDFPKHVIEFSAFTCRVGVLRKHMAVWEVRYY